MLLTGVGPGAVGPPQPVVLDPQSRGKATHLGGRERGHGGPHPKATGLDPHQPLSDQRGQVDRPGQHLVAAGRSDQAHEVGDCAWAQHRRPEPSYVRMVEGIAEGSECVVPRSRAHGRPPPNGTAESPRPARGWRGSRGDGRTSITTGGLGLGPGALHSQLIANSIN